MTIRILVWARNLFVNCAEFCDRALWKTYNPFL